MEALASVVCPVVKKLPVTVRAVEDAVPMEETADVRLLDDRLVAVVVARVEVPVTVRVPFETREEVAVIVPPVIVPDNRVEKTEDREEKKEATSPVVVVVPVTFTLFA